MFVCPHPTDPDFENLKKVFFFLFTVQKYTNPILEISENFFIFILQFLHSEM